MPSSTKRLTCRVGFLLFCLAPTVLVCGLIVAQRTPAWQAAQRRAWEDQFRQLLGVDVHVGRVASSPDGTTLLETVQFEDPETGATLGSVRLLEVVLRDGRCQVVASQPEFDNRHLGRLWETLHGRLLCGTESRWAVGAVVVAQELTVRAEQGNRTLTDVELRIESTELGPQTTFEFRVAGLQMESPAQLRIIRNREMSPPATGWVLHTRNTPLPCTLLAEYAPPLGQLGGESHFSGSVWATRKPAGWEGEVSGELSGLDLDRIVTGRFPHKLSGTATATISIARFVRGQLQEAAGELRCGQGVVSVSLLDALSRSLGVPLHEEVDRETGPQRLEFRELAIGFRLDEGGLALSALNPQTAKPALLLDKQGKWLLAERTQSQVPVIALVHALVPDSTVQVPATRQTQPLLKMLPIPAVQPGDTDRRPYSPLRLRQE